MFRWYGNSLRQNGRALGLGPSRLGWFTYYVLLDQRILMWTGLLGLALAIAASITLDRKSVVYGKSVSVRVDIGGRRIIKKKMTTKDRQTETMYIQQLRLTPTITTTSKKCK